MVEGVREVLHQYGDRYEASSDIPAAPLAPPPTPPRKKDEQVRFVQGSINVSNISIDSCLTSNQGFKNISFSF